VSSRTWSPQQLEIIYAAIEHVAEQSYRLGQEDSAAGKSLESKDFRLSKARRLELKTILQKTLEKR